MSITIEEVETGCVIRFEGEIDISCSDELKRMLIDVISSGKELQLDLTQASDLDVTAMQLLWAAAREADKAGVSLTVAGQIPENIRCAVHEAGFENLPVSAISQSGPADSKASLAGSVDDRQI